MRAQPSPATGGGAGLRGPRPATRATGAHTAIETFESYGVPLAVNVVGTRRHPLVAAVAAILPPLRAPLAPGIHPVATLNITASAERFTVYGGATGRQDFANEVEAIHALDREIRAVVSLAAPRHVFVHAGVVSVGAGAIVIPGRSFTGKTTLVGALVRAGATYLSDEYAVLDHEGSVWPYPRALSFRTDEGRSDVAPSTLGAVADARSTPIAAIVSTSFRSDAHWQPTQVSPADGALALLDNAVAARVRSGDVLATVVAAARPARCLRSPRGDADQTAAALLRLLEASSGSNGSNGSNAAHPTV